VLRKAYYNTESSVNERRFFLTRSFSIRAARPQEGVDPQVKLGVLKTENFKRDIVV